MTPKEKAKDLVFKKFGCSKQYASIAVDEILDDDMYGMEEEHFEKRINYWEEVKQEIEKL
jgi:hypothetical protein